VHVRKPGMKENFQRFPFWCHKSIHVWQFPRYKFFILGTFHPDTVYFCNWFLLAVHDGFLDPKLMFFTSEAWFLLTGYISAENNRYWSSIN
jgi:hypothetical protein